MAEKKNFKKSNKGKKVVKKVALFQPGELVYGEYEYRMSKQCALNILHDPITGKKLPGDEGKLLCDFVNHEYGLKGTCVSVVIVG